MFFLDKAWLIPLIPALSFVVILFFGKRMPRHGSEVGIAAVGASFVLVVRRAVQWINRVQDAKGGTALGALGRSIGHLGAEGGEAQVLPVLGPARAAQTARREIGGRSGCPGARVDRGAWLAGKSTGKAPIVSTISPLSAASVLMQKSPQQPEPGWWAPEGRVWSP